MAGKTTYHTTGKHRQKVRLLNITCWSHLKGPQLASLSTVSECARARYPSLPSEAARGLTTGDRGPQHAHQSGHGGDDLATRSW